MLLLLLLLLLLLFHRFLMHSRSAADLLMRRPALGEDANENKTKTHQQNRNDEKPRSAMDVNPNPFVIESLHGSHGANRRICLVENMQGKRVPSRDRCLDTHTHTHTHTLIHMYIHKRLLFICLLRVCIERGRASFVLFCFCRDFSPLEGWTTCLFPIWWD